MPTCDVSDCERRTIARGWCTKHYQRWQSHGDPTVTLKPHRISNVDEDSRLGDCEKCGPKVPVRVHLSWWRCTRSAAQWKERSGMHLVTREEHDALLVRQGGRCAVCRRETKLCVDHDHVTGEVRGLLCNRCNRALHVVEDEEWATALLAYLGRS